VLILWRLSAEHHERTVNDLLANLRRSNLNLNGSQSNHASPPVAPSVPPELSQLLRLPETPAPRPRRLQRRDANGRRIPPGPPPPRSWLSLSQSRHAPQHAGDVQINHIQYWPLPGQYLPDDGSLLDMLLNRLVADWEIQRDWNRFYLYTLPSRLRSALISCVSRYHEAGLSTADLKLILAGPPAAELAEYDLQKPDPTHLNNDIRSVDLTGSVGRVVSLKTLTDLLCPTAPADAEVRKSMEVADSWDAPEPSLPAQVPTSGLLPNLTQLSLGRTSLAQSASWRQLLALAARLPQLTALNLTGWPAPSMLTTQHATLATVVSPVTGAAVQYGGTGAYSHVLDDDWSEAVVVLKRLSRSLYGLEHLDLTGCGDWLPALRRAVDAHLVVDRVDWAHDWGKITTLRLRSGYAVDPRAHGPDASAQRDRINGWRTEALAVERHIRGQRAGQGRFINVETDEVPEEAGPAGLGLF
jgi:hypothetical protein